MDASATGGRLDVRSVDGTPLAVWVDGQGPPIVLVHGALNDHRMLAPLVRELRGSLTTFTMDRRGRGSSGDADDYDLRREFEDVAAVVDAVRARDGGPVSLWGHSYGADCAMGAATLTDGVGRLVLYEPGLGITYPVPALAAIDSEIAAGDLEAAAVALYVELVGLSDEEVELLREQPTWSARVENVPSLPRELRAELAWTYEPGQFDGITASTLVLAGQESPPEQDQATRRAVAAIAGARLHVLARQGHAAHQTDPGTVAAVVREFVAP
jgi:pimeloyl-ACP methyl ester carboxylesterase